MRPSWQIDLKWMLGLAACLLIAVSGVLYSLSHLTQREVAIPVASALVSAGINDRMSDEEYAQVQAVAAANPTSNVTLSPISLTLSGSEIAGLSKEDTAAVAGAKLAGVVYDNGSGAAKALIVEPAPESGQKAVSLGPVGALTADNNSLFTMLFIALTALALLMLAGVAVLSRGFGRLGAPAFIVSIGTVPLAFLWVAAGSAVGPGDSGEGVFAHTAREAFRGAAGDLSTVFAGIAGAAVAASVLCALGGVVTTIAGKSTAAETAHTEAQAAEAKAAEAPKPVAVPQTVTTALKPGQVPGIPQIAKSEPTKQRVA